MLKGTLAAFWHGQGTLRVVILSGTRTTGLQTVPRSIPQELSPLTQGQAHKGIRCLDITLPQKDAGGAGQGKASANTG
jgi:hypothetical protein